MLLFARRQDATKEGEAMLTRKGGGTRRTTVFTVLAAVSVAAMLAAADAALAGPDPLSSSSSVTLQLRSSGGLKLKPKTLALPVNPGSQLDPTTGAGTIQTKGAFKARQGGRKTKVKITLLTFGANAYSEPGKMNAKVGKKKVKGFAKLSGGTLTRDGFGAKLDGVSARLSKKGAKALKKALAPGGGGKAKKASASAGGIKAGKPLGTVSVTSVPTTVEVLPGGTLEFESNNGFGLKLALHCVNAVPSDPNVEIAVAPIAPATEPATGLFIFPVTGGSIAPDLSSGKVTSAGGQKLVKNMNGVFPNTPAGCSEGPAVGTTVTQTEWEAEFDIKALATNTTLPTGNIGFGALGPFNLAAATSSSADPSTKQVTVTLAPVRMDPLGAVVFNNVFPNATGNPSFDFLPGDLLGWMSLTVTTH
jgi:hypothetical protein